MLQESPKQKGIRKNRQGQVKLFLTKLAKISTKANAKSEPRPPKNSYTKTIKYNPSAPK